MTNQITPPPELVVELCNKAFFGVDGLSRGEIEALLIQEAFQAGADQELEACCEWLATNRHILIGPALRAARRPTPKPPTLKEQALAELENILKNPQSPLRSDTETIRRALEQLND